MNQTAFLLLERPVSWGEAAFGFAGLVLLLLSLALLSSWRSGRRHAAEAGAAAERAREMDDKVAEMNRMQAELTGRMQTMAEILSTRQGDLARLVADRIDGLRQQVGSGLEQNVRQTTEHLGKLQERLAVIDGVVDETIVRTVVEHLHEKEKAVVVGKGVLPEAEALLAELSPGSRIRKAPGDLFGKATVR